MTNRKVKDDSFKLIFGTPELFAEFLKDYIPVDILKNVTASDIEDLSERFIPLFQDSKDSDTVKRIKLKDNPPLYVIAILEHQSEVNFRTSFRLLQYITLVLAEYEKEADKEYEKEHKGKKTKFSATKGFKYPPVLPMVFYDSDRNWTAKTNFYDKTELKEIFEKYIPKFEYELVRLSDYDKETLISIGGVLSLIMLIDKVKDTGDMRELSELPKDYMDKLSTGMPPHLRKLVFNVITALLKRINIPDEEIEKVTENFDERGVQEMFAWADKYDVQETRRIARAEQAIAIAKNLLKENMPIDKIAEVTGLSIEEIERLTLN